MSLHKQEVTVRVAHANYGLSLYLFNEHNGGESLLDYIEYEQIPEGFTDEDVVRAYFGPYGVA